MLQSNHVKNAFDSICFKAVYLTDNGSFYHCSFVRRQVSTGHAQRSHRSLSITTMSMISKGIMTVMNGTPLNIHLYVCVCVTRMSLSRVYIT